MPARGRTSSDVQNARTVLDVEATLTLLNGGEFRQWSGDFPPVFVGAVMAKSVIIPQAGASGNIYALGTLSWFWVPVILMAFQVQVGLSRQHINIIMVDTGALFDFQALVSAVSSMIVGGQFRLNRQEIVAQAGGMVYIAASAQDRLRDMLNAARPDLMLPVSAWINHLYYCELLYLTRNMQAVPAGPSMEADGWLSHSYRNLLTQSIVHVQASAMGLMVPVDANRWGHRVTVADLHTELLSSNIRMGRGNNNRAAFFAQEAPTYGTQC
jgi:hypothetical protein